MQWLRLTLFSILTFCSAQAAAQCAGGVAQGDVDPANPCQLCNGGEFESLPPRTACGAEQRYQCDSRGVFRLECVEEPAGSMSTVCSEQVRAPECPNGLVCEAGFCLQSCVTDSDCRAGFECRTETCVVLDATDMGGPDMTADMGTPDMRVTADLGTRDLGLEDTGGGGDVSQPDTGSEGGKDPSSDSGCSTSAPAADTPLWLLVFGLLWMWRRRDA